MTIEIPEKTYTAEEYMRLAQSAEYEGRSIELVEGRIVEMVGGGSGQHGETVMKISLRAGNFIEANNLGRVTGAETGYYLGTTPDGKETIRCPDFGFVTFEHAPEPLDEGFVPLAPDFAVEVVSPGNDANEIQDKVRAYLAAGTRLVWVVYPKSRTVNVYTPTGGRLHKPEDVLDGGAVLPGFTVPVRELFPS